MTVMNTENMMTRRELSPEEEAMVAAGTFTPNTYRKSGYQSVGISTSYHFFDKDEFMFMGKSISYDQANSIVKMANGVLDAMNTGARGANKVGTTDEAFIRGFNSQLYLEYGMVWDGVPGSDF